MTSAEAAYLFRHALVREGAYQLLPPQQRAELHVHAIEALECLFEEGARDPIALELAEHAVFAQAGRRTGNLTGLKALADLEARYLRRAAEYAQAQYRSQESAQCWLRLAARPGQPVSASVESLRQAAHVLTRHGFAKEAEAPARQAVELAADPACDAGNRGLALQAMGVVLYNLGRLEQAERCFQQAFDTHQAADQHADRAQALMNLGVVHTVAGRSDDAEREYRAAIELLRNEREAKRLCTAVANLGNLYSGRGRLPEAEKLYTEARELARQAGDRLGEGTILDYIGTLYAYQERWVESYDWYVQAINVRTETRDRTNMATSFGNIANVCATLGRKAEAAGYYERALAIHREAANPAGVCANLLSIAGDRLDVSLDEAQELIKEAEQAAEQAESPRLIGTCQGYFAVLALKRGDLAEALRFWEKALAVLEAAGAVRERNLLTRELRKQLELAGLAVSSWPGL